MAKAVAAEAGKPGWKPYVDALMRLKGIDVQTAFLACAEFGDFSRFRSGRRVSRWLGCTPSEGSTGESRRRGRIAEEGGGRLRRALVEGVSTISRQTAHKKRLRPGHEVSPSVEGIAVEANARLKRKHDALKKAGKHADTAKVAVVSELARWTWAIGLQVQREQAAAQGGPGPWPSPPRSRGLRCAVPLALATCAAATDMRRLALRERPGTSFDCPPRAGPATPPAPERIALRAGATR